MGCDILLTAEETRREEPIELKTVLADPNFDFPSPEFFVRLEGQGAKPQRLSAALQRMLKTFSHPFSPTASSNVIKAQVMELCKQFPRSLEPQQNYIVSSMPSLTDKAPTADKGRGGAAETSAGETPDSGAQILLSFDQKQKSPGRKASPVPEGVLEWD